MANSIAKFLGKLGLRQKTVLTLTFLGLLVGLASNIVIQRTLQPILENTLPTLKNGEQILKMTQQLQAESALFFATGNKIHSTRFNNTSSYIDLKLNIYSDLLNNSPEEKEILDTFKNTLDEIKTVNKSIIDSHIRTLALLEALDTLEDNINALSISLQKDINDEVLQNIQEENLKTLQNDTLPTKDLLASFFAVTKTLEKDVNEYVVLSENKTLLDINENFALLEEIENELSLALKGNETQAESILNQIINIREQVESLSKDILASHSETLSLIKTSNSIAEKVDAESVRIERLVDAEVENALNTSRNSILISLFAGLFVALIGYLIVNVLLRQILELVSVSKRIAGGKLYTRAKVTSQDEIGVLATSFNEMAEKMQSLLGGLEEQVEERTAELEEVSFQTQKRVSQLQTIAEVASSVASIQDIDELLPHITQSVSEHFGFYHTGIFLLSEDKKYAVLRAANSDGGQIMLARNHQLQIGQEGIVGFAASQKQTRIALDVGEDAVYFNNPDLPDTHSEIALPLLVGNEIIGVLDVQSKEANAFSTEDINVFTTLANQVAVAIQNANLFRQSEKALEELDANFRRYISNEWNRFGELTNIKGYRAIESGLEPIKESLQKDVKSEKTDNKHKIPIKLRNVIIGHLDVDLKKPVEQYSTDELDIIQATVDRFAIALENARLLETTSRRAARERLVSDITTKIRSTNDPQTMIQTALAELKEALNVSRVELVPQNENAEKEN